MPGIQRPDTIAIAGPQGFANPIARSNAVSVRGRNANPIARGMVNVRGRVLRGPVPDWQDPSGQLPPQQSADTQRASAPQVTQAPTIAEDAFIPIIFGGPERIAGMPYTTCATPDGQVLIMSFILCEGEVDSVSAIELNNEAVPGGVTITIYTGKATQGVDPILAAYMPGGFAETFPNTAYVVAAFPKAIITTVPTLTALVVGLKIPDSRNANALGGWDNPALILAYFMRTYAGRLVNVASVNAAANWCDVVIGANRRAVLVLTLAEARDAADWIEVLRGYLPAWVINRDGEWFIVPDQTSAPVLDYNADSDARTDGASPMVLNRRGARDVPNVVDVQWTDTSVKPWATRKATAQVPGLGGSQRRRTTIALPGIRAYAQAYRFAVERLNHYTLEAIEGDVSVMDEGISIVPGDILTITDAAYGWSAKPVRVLRTQESDNGRWAVHFREFSELAYSTDAPAAPPATSGSNLPNPRNVAAITGLVTSESLKFENASIGNDGIARGLIWQSRIEATWDASADPFFDLYEVTIKGDALSQPSVSASRLAQFSSSPLIQGSTYTLSVRVINTLGFSSAWVSSAVTIQGKTTPPGDVTALDFAAEISGEVILRWQPVPQPDVVRYEWRGLATAAATAPWDSMTPLDRPDTNYTRIKGLAPGATLFAIKAIDSVGRYSVNPLYVNVTITSDASAFLQQFDFSVVPASSTNIVQQDFPLDERNPTARPLPRFISKGTTAWNAAMPNPVASVATPVVNAWGRAAAFILRTDTFDFGVVLDATVNLNLTWVRAVKGNSTLYVLNSTDGTTYSNATTVALVQGAVNGWVAVKVTARFVKLEIWSTANTDAVVVEGKINTQVGSTSKKESGSGTSLASGPLRVNLAQKYSKSVAITIVPKGTTFASASFDNVIVGLATTPNSFDVYLFNSSAVQIARDFSWTFAGV